MLSGNLARYSPHGLMPLKDVPNLSTLIEQINSASIRACADMRASGAILRPGASDVPLLDEIDRHLRSLTCDAYLSYLATREEARRESPTTPDWEIEGEATDDLHFDVYLSGLPGAPKDFLTVQVSLRLV
jgi:hypothetical protein